MLTPEKKKEIISALVGDIKGVMRNLFMGAGSYNGKYFEIGDVSGNPGDSLKVNIYNGVWEDYGSGGGSREKGDIIELFSRKYGGFKLGMNQIYSYLNIPRFKDTIEKATKKYTVPKVTWKSLTPKSKVYSYLTIDRKITEEVLTECQVKELTDERGSWYCFICHTLEGQLCAAKFTNLNRDKEGKKIERQEKNPLSILWGIHSFLAKDFDFAIITEGQIDAMSFKTQGVKNVVSMPMGTNNTDWVYSSWDWLLSFKYIYLCFDNDKAGVDALDVISKKIGLEKCKRIDIPLNYNDANEAHINGFDLTTLIKSAKDFKPDRLVSVMDLFEKSWEVVAGGKREERGIPFCGWDGESSINFKQRPAELTLITGYAGSGKSTMLYQDVANLVFKYEQKVVIASLEETSEQLAVLTAIIAAGRQFGQGDKALLKHIYSIAASKLFFYDFRGRAEVDKVLQTAEYAIRRHGCQHFVFDSIAKTDLLIEDSGKMNEFVGKVCNSMDETGAHYHLVAHARKGSDKDFAEIPTLQEVKGAASLGIEAFNCLTMWRNKPKEGMIAFGERTADSNGNFKKYGVEGRGKDFNLNEIRRDWADGILVVSKQKVGGQLGQYNVWYDKETYSYKRSYSEELLPLIPELVSDEDDELEDAEE